MPAADSVSLPGSDIAIGDREAFYGRLRKNLKCFFSAGKFKDADDMAQEVMVRLLRTVDSGLRPDLQQAEAQTQFAYGIAKNVKREWVRPANLASVGIDQCDPAWFSIPPYDMISRDCAELIRRTIEASLARLGPKQRDTIRARNLTSDNPKPFSEIAASIGVSEVAARQLAVQARNSLFREIRSSPDWGAFQKCREGGGAR